MDALIALVAMVAVLALFGYAALRWGDDSRDRLTPTWLHQDSMSRGV